MIYFARLATGAIKIGTAADPRKRMVGLASDYDSPVVLLKTMPGGREEELVLHERFNHLRLGKKEQFRPGRDLLKFIGQSPKGWPDPRKVWAQARWDEIGHLEILQQMAKNREQMPAGDASEKAVAKGSRISFAAEMRRASDELRQVVEAKRRARAAKSQGMCRRDVEEEECLQWVAGEDEIYREVCILEGGVDFIDLQDEH